MKLLGAFAHLKSRRDAEMQGSGVQSTVEENGAPSFDVSKIFL